MPTSSFEFASAWINRLNGWGRFTASERLNGKTATWSAVWWQGELVCSQVRRRMYWEHADLVPSGVTGITGAQTTVDDPELNALSTRAIRALDQKPHGIISVDFTYREGFEDPRITEIQASRFYTSIHFITMAGLNMPEIFLKLGNGIGFEWPAQTTGLVAPDQMWIKYSDKASRLTSVSEIENHHSEMLMALEKMVY